MCPRAWLSVLWWHTDVLFGAIIAAETGMVTGTLWQVPNQPIVFAQDPTKEERSEDAAVAFTWLEFMFHQDRDDFVLFFPMVKSVHSALTAIQQYAASKHGVKIENFVVAGASKRGWTTWLEGATDDRVVAIVPIVMDMLNFQKNVGHMFTAYGGWTFAFEDYYKVGAACDGVLRVAPSTHLSSLTSASVRVPSSSTSRSTWRRTTCRPWLR